MMKTITVEIAVSRRVGQTIFVASERTCWRNVKGLVLEAITCSRLNGPQTSKLARRELRALHKGIG
jgi:hypothetical protein